jgi:lysophospholipase L1-like esterase
MADLLATIITIKPNDPRIHYYGFANLRVSSREAVSDRMIPDSHYRTDNPAALIKFETDASEVSIVLSYARVDSIPGRTSWAGDGLVSVEFSNSVQIGRAKGSSGPQISKIKMGEVTRRTVEVMLPYGDTVSFLGIGLPKGAELYQIKREVLPCYVAYGDSITQGFRATNPVETYPVRLSRAKKWELFNMGFGSRRATIPDGAVLARLKPDIVTMMIGVNDCLGGKPVARYAADAAGLVTEFRRTMRTTPVFFITPLPVAEPAKWKNSEKLDSYRVAATQALTNLNDPNLHIIDGTTLIEPKPALFADGLHPNASGFEMIARNLEQAITL